MKALVVYDSIYGNTEKLAHAMGDTLASQADVRVLRLGDVRPEHLVGLSLLVAGSPTHGGRVSKGAYAWLKTVAAGSLHGVKVAAYDTRVPVSEIKSSVVRFLAGLFGFAAAATIANTLTRNGGTLVVPPEGFGVKDTKGPLVDGELERATAWVQQVARM